MICLSLLSDVLNSFLFKSSRGLDFNSFNFVTFLIDHFRVFTHIKFQLKARTMIKRAAVRAESMLYKDAMAFREKTQTVNG